MREIFLKIGSIRDYLEWLGKEMKGEFLLN